jgi:hypothetical protein
LNGVATHVGTRIASAESEALAVAVRIEFAADPALVPMATVAAPAAVTAVVGLMAPPNTTAFAGMVSELAGVQLAPPSTAKL